MRVRRVFTGHDRDGKAVFASDQQLPAFGHLNRLCVLTATTAAASGQTQP